MNVLPTHATLISCVSRLGAPQGSGLQVIGFSGTSLSILGEGLFFQPCPGGLTGFYIHCASAASFPLFLFSSSPFSLRWESWEAENEDIVTSTTVRLGYACL